MENITPNGTHYLIEFFGCDEKQINDVNFWKKMLRESVDGTTIEILHDFFFEFQPYGITGYLLLSASHISVHTWPENGYVVCDVFTCSLEKETKHVVEHIKDNVIHDRIEIKKVQRGFKELRRSGAMATVDACSFEKYQMGLPVFCTGDMMQIDVLQDIIEIETAFQKIKIVDTKEFGKCLIIDGVMQTSEKDHYIYDREMIKKLRPTDENILILGGGDGYVAARVVAEDPSVKVKVDVVDLDVEVVKTCERYLGQDIFCHEQVHLSIGDALHFMRVSSKKYDGIICDLTDTPIGTKKEADEFESFFDEIISLAREVLHENGWISVQSGATHVVNGFVDEASIIKKIMIKNDISNISRSDVFIPSYGESCAFLFGKKE